MAYCAEIRFRGSFYSNFLSKSIAVYLILYPLSWFYSMHYLQILVNQILFFIPQFNYHPRRDESHSTDSTLPRQHPKHRLYYHIFSHSKFQGPYKWEFHSWLWASNQTWFCWFQNRQVWAILQGCYWRVKDFRAILLRNYLNIPMDSIHIMAISYSINDNLHILPILFQCYMILSSVISVFCAIYSYRSPPCMYSKMRMMQLSY